MQVGGLRACDICEPQEVFAFKIFSNWFSYNLSGSPSHLLLHSAATCGVIVSYITWTKTSKIIVLRCHAPHVCSLDMKAFLTRRSILQKKEGINDEKRQGYGTYTHYTTHFKCSSFCRWCVVIQHYSTRVRVFMFLLWIRTRYLCGLTIPKLYFYKMCSGFVCLRPDIYIGGEMKRTKTAGRKNKRRISRNMERINEKLM